MAAIFSAVGLVFMLTRIDFGSRNSGSASIEINERAIAELESIEAFIDPSDPEQGKEVADQIVERALSTPGLLEPIRGRALPNEAQLRQLITDRLMLMFNPEYDVFVRQVGELLGQDGRESLQGTMFEDEKLWIVFASTYKDAGVAIDTTRATLDLGSVTMGDGLWGGRQTQFGDPGVYGANQLVESGATVFNIGIPVMIPPENKPDAKIMVLFATLSFVWDQSRNKWLPYRTAVYDPSGTLGALPALWM